MRFFVVFFFYTCESFFLCLVEGEHPNGVTHLFYPACNFRLNDLISVEFCCFIVTVLAVRYLNVDH